MPTLLAVWGPKRGLRLEISHTVVLGRASTATVQLFDEKVSREHCQLQVQPGSSPEASGRVSITDLGSHNGTFVNGTRLLPAQAQLLSTGDEILVGDSLFFFDAPAQVLATRWGDLAVILSHEATQAHVATTAPSVPAQANPGVLKALIHLGMQLGQVSDPEAAATAVLDAISAMLPTQRLFLLQTSAQGPRPLAGRSDDKVIPLSHALFEQVRQRGSTVRLSQPAQGFSSNNSRSAIHMTDRTVMMAPIQGDGVLAGYLYADRAAEQAFSASDEITFTAFASAVAAAGLLTPKQLASAHEPSSRPVGNSAAFAEALALAGKAARSDATVLITGETGTGKEEVARFVHAQSGRHAGPFVAINCGAIAETLAASELFGHEKGAFTGAQTTRVGLFEAAESGTLFLDEVGELSPALQVQLLRVVQERVLFRVGSTTPRPIDVRLVAATHRNLADPKTGFRSDLYYRLNVISLALPPLRERLDDLEALAKVLVERMSQKMGRKPVPVAASACKALASWQWPGNVRELANVIERMLVLRPPHEQAPLDGDDVRAALGAALAPAANAGPVGNTLAAKVESLERQEITKALQAARGVKSRAASALGISRPTLDKKLHDLGIDLWA